MLTVILTGGASSRMGQDKALLELGGATMLSLLVEKYKTLGDVAISVDKAGRFPTYGAAELIDRYPGMGPLNGVISAFGDTAADTIFLTATDLPNGDVTLATELLSRTTRDFDACVIGVEEWHCDPLFAVYTRACLDAAVDCVEHGQHSFSSMLRKLRVNYVNPSELSGWNLKRILLNVNTPEEYEKVSRDV